MGNKYHPCKASEWLIELMERPEDFPLRQEFDRWLAADPDNERDWHEISHTYAVIGNLRPIAQKPESEETNCTPVSNNVVAIDALGSPAQRPRRRRRAALSMLAAGLAAGLAILIVDKTAPRIDADHGTQTAETKKVALADGSQVWLAPESALSVTFSQGKRQIQLHSGLAYFDVAHDPERPFVVQAHHVETSVLGTGFEVDAAESAVRVAVKEGSVQVNHESETEALPARLTVGNWGSVSADGTYVAGQVRPAQVASWINQRLVAKDLPVGRAVEQIRRYYNGTVLLRGQRLARKTLTGVYNLEKPVDALRAIAEAQNAKFFNITPWLVVIIGS